MSDCSIKSETGRADDRERVLSCTYEENEEVRKERREETSRENVFRLAKFDFSKQAKSRK